MSDLIEKLRNAANQHPLDAPMDLFNVAAERIEELQQKADLTHCANCQSLNDNLVCPHESKAI